MLLLAMVRLGEDACAVPISKRVAPQCKERSQPRLHLPGARETPRKLGFVSSSSGRVTEERGGRAKRFFSRNAEWIARDQDDSGPPDEFFRRDTCTQGSQRMTARNPNPPGLAVWWLRATLRGRYNEALTGDLIERFREGETCGWFWRQVLIASGISALREIGRRWTFFCYAAAGTVAICSPPMYAGIQVPTLLGWSRLPWPLSQVVFELSTNLMVASISLCVLAAGLAVERSFRWISLSRTWIINLTLLVFGHYAVDLFPWLLRAVPGDPYHHKVLIIPGNLQVLLVASNFLVAAWLGCPLIERAGRPHRLTSEL
jgi:hypothetical protein